MLASYVGSRVENIHTRAGDVEILRGYGSNDSRARRHGLGRLKETHRGVVLDQQVKEDNIRSRQRAYEGNGVPGAPTLNGLRTPRCGSKSQGPTLKILGWCSTRGPVLYCTRYNAGKQGKEDRM